MNKDCPRDHSSAGRAPALQAGGHRFEPCWSHYQETGHAAVAELADAQDLKSCGTYTPVPVRFRFAAVNSDSSEFFFYGDLQSKKVSKKDVDKAKVMC